MESKANYALIGTFVLVALISAMGFIAYISGRQFDEQYDEYIVEYFTPPRGITIGSEVRFNGIKMGEVIDTELENEKTVLVYIRVKPSTPIRVDTYGKNEPLGLTGLSYIQLLPGTSTEYLKPSQPGKLARITGKQSQIDYLLGGSESIINNINIALARATSLLSDDAITDFQGFLKKLNTVMGEIAEADLSSERVKFFMDTIEKTALNISDAAIEIVKTSQEFTQFVTSDETKNIILSADKTLIAAETALTSFSKLAKDGSNLSDETLRTIEHFSATGLQDLSLAMADLRVLVDSLNRVSNNLEKNPVDFIIGQKKEIMELPQ
ncbi:MAG: MlaD family protein [Robiginitomaculum sp.]